MNVLIAGATGSIGRTLVPYLQRNKIDTVCICRPESRHHPTGDIWQLDLTRRPPVEPLFKLDAAIYLAQSRKYKEVPDGAPDVYDLNVSAAIWFAELSRKCGARKMIFASSGSVYTPSFEPQNEQSEIGATSIYAESKIAAEAALKHYERYLEIIILRPYALYGPGVKEGLVRNILKCVAEGKTISLQRKKPGESPVQGFTTTPCYVSDAAGAILARC